MALGQGYIAAFDNLINSIFIEPAGDLLRGVAGKIAGAIDGIAGVTGSAVAGAVGIGGALTGMFTSSGPSASPSQERSPAQQAEVNVQGVSEQRNMNYQDVGMDNLGNLSAQQFGNAAYAYKGRSSTDGPSF